ncbi:PulJ/GspJ family protein [Paenibacillus cymbidii]|uniref:PulJ/GspJ family protein n=1 Tax=Paenibacillus cymbidii TaxID=1639034 RepID=UPI0010815E77|nr:prepilin-type N-terminal cleavage/methylation domain-containing protein [Paenibacillus cymbidii]
MRNERGMSLVEVMAAVVIGALIIGGATMLLSSVLHLSNSSAQSFTDRAAIKLTESTVSKQLSESTQVVAYTHNSVDRELRYNNFDGAATYKSLYYDGTTRSLTLYDYSNDGTAANDSADFLNSSYTPSTASGRYTNPIALASDVASISFDTAKSTSQPVGPTPFPAAGSMPTVSRMLYIKVTFGNKIVTNMGETKDNPQSRIIAVKLLADWTDQ